ncbi:MAG: sigma-54-dependent Fis family transcriptional regulator [Pirellulaceae bacterium]|nr:sigma-54-dependent Fis family transcriptional regulator [Pirellulaceae bacterium]
MPDLYGLDDIAGDAELARAAAALLGISLPEREVQAYLESAMPILSDLLNAEFTTIAVAEKGRWRTRAGGNPEFPLPEELLAEALDREQTVVHDKWLAVPLPIQIGAVHVLVTYNSQVDQERHQQLAEVFLSGLASVRDRQRQASRIQRLEALVQIAAEWQQASEMDELLNQMAQASTELLGAERASIFLWDRRNKILVGRPALGVEGGELRIPEDTGIVGQVVQSGETRRVDADEDQREIDRSVDAQLEFQTRSLLCAPLRNSSGKILGAFEMINKVYGNFTPDDEETLLEMAAHAAVALEKTHQFSTLLQSKNRVADQAAEGIKMIGQCAEIERLRATVARVADTELAVLILGENGTGKEVVAQQMHYLSKRRNEPFVAINCAALSETLLESELFGHEKGAFTDAYDTRVGKFELASGGTLFLDEIGDMSLGGQAKLLRVLEEKIVVRVGGSQPIHTDARVVAATNQNLAELVRDRRFREDLYFRLNVVSIDLPALRDRGEDILRLAEFFLQDFCTNARREMPQFSAAAEKRLLGHPWPGNVRELRNLMERLAYLSTGDRVNADELAFILSPAGEETSAISLEMELNDATREFQVDFIKRQIDRAGGNMTEVAKRLGLHRSNLYRKMRQLDMDVHEL